MRPAHAAVGQEYATLELQDSLAGDSIADGRARQLAIVGMNVFLEPVTVRGAGCGDEQVTFELPKLSRP